jgi:hypothetical protein
MGKVGAEGSAAGLDLCAAGVMDGGCEVQDEATQHTWIPIPRTTLADSVGRRNVLPRVPTP